MVQRRARNGDRRQPRRERGNRIRKTRREKTGDEIRAGIVTIIKRTPAGMISPGNLLGRM